MGGADAGGARGRTLVFARDVAAANEAADFLFDCGLPVMAYHRGVPAAEREAALETLARCTLWTPRRASGLLERCIDVDRAFGLCIDVHTWILL